MAKIKITQLFRYLKRGFVAMDADGTWYWYENKPHKGIVHETWVSNGNGDFECLGSAFNIAPVDNWEQSLQRVSK